MAYYGRELYNDCDCSPCECFTLMNRSERKRWEITEAWEERRGEVEKRYRDYITQDWLAGVSPQTLQARYF